MEVWKNPILWLLPSLHPNPRVGLAAGSVQLQRVSSLFTVDLGPQMDVWSPKTPNRLSVWEWKSGGSSLPPPISLSWSHPLWLKDFFSFSHPQMPGIFISTRQALREVIHACSQRRRLCGFWTNFYSNPYFSLLSTTISSKNIDPGPEARKEIAWLIHYIIPENF